MWPPVSWWRGSVGAARLWRIASCVRASFRVRSRTSRSARRNRTEVRTVKTSVNVMTGRSGGRKICRYARSPQEPRPTPGAGGGGPEEDDPSPKQGRIRGALQDGGGRKVGEGAVASAEIQQQVAVPVEGDPPPVKAQRFHSLRSRLEDRFSSVSAQVDGQCEGRVEHSFVADRHGNAPQYPVRVGSDVEKSRGSRGFRQDRGGAGPPLRGA